MSVPVPAGASLFQFLPLGVWIFLTVVAVLGVWTLWRIFGPGGSAW